MDEGRWAIAVEKGKCRQKGDQAEMVHGGVLEPVVVARESEALRGLRPHLAAASGADAARLDAIVYVSKPIVLRSAVFADAGTIGAAMLVMQLHIAEASCRLDYCGRI